MDILKQCTTNVQEINGLSDLQLALYEREEGSSLYRRDDSGTATLVTQIRASGILCTLVHSAGNTATTSDARDEATQLCIFGECDPELTALIVSSGFSLFLEGPLFDNAEVELINGATAEEELLRAIEISITHELWQTRRGTRIGHCTWLLYDALASSGTVVSIDLSWSEIDVHMLIATITSSKDLHFRPIDLAASTGPAPSVALLAPSGAQALLTSSREQTSRGMQDEPWRIAVREALASEGIDIRLDTDWVEVTTGVDLQVVIWPATLTFAEITLGASAAELHTEVSDDRANEQYSGAPEYTDPLLDAELWFNDTVLRDRQPVALTGSDDAPLENVAASDFLSAAMLQRPENLAAGYLYPTPPDGMVGFQHSQQTPNISSTPAAQATGQLQDATQGMEHASSDQDANSGEGIDTRPRGPSIVSSVGATHGYTGHHEDLFGDLGGDEVDEEDFSFFDEPDDVRVVDEQIATTADAGVAMTELGDEAQTSSNADAEDALLVPESDDAGALSQQRESEFASAVTDNLDDAMAIDVDHGANADQLSVQAQTTESTNQHASLSEHRPLTPLTIKEQLLPPPVPYSASMGSASDSGSHRKGRYAALAFGQHCASDVIAGLESVREAPVRDVPAKAAHPASTSMRGMLRRTGGTDESSERDDRSDTPVSSEWSTSSASSPELHITAYEGEATSRKRKRHTLIETAETADAPPDWITRLPMFTHDSSDRDRCRELRRRAHDMVLLRSSEPNNIAKTLGVGEHHGTDFPFQDCTSQDLVMIAQILAEQALTTTHTIADNLRMMSLDASSLEPSSATAAADTVLGVLNNIVPSTKHSDVAALILTRELPARPTPAITATAKVMGQPRPPPPRHDSTATAGPDVQSLTLPYMRVTRASDKLELLPTAMQFWDALGLGPVSGGKNVRYYCVAPKSEHLAERLEYFMHELSQAYEGCNLGEHRAVGATDESMPEQRWKWLLAVDCAAQSSTTDSNCNSASLKAAWLHYSELMGDLGEILERCAHDDPAITSVVYLIDSFSTVLSTARPALCAAFHTAYKMYVAMLAQNAGEDGFTKPASDLVLQILPMDLIYRPHELVIPTSARMASLAREVYDRLPLNASQKPSASDPAIPTTTAPCVHLAPTILKRINFQLLADPPHDLLQEGSVLHLAYSFTPDRHWLAVHWTDAAGTFADSTALSMRGRSVAEMFERVWERTLSAMDRKQIPWKVCITRAMRRVCMPAWEAQCWRDVVGEKTRRRQVTSVTLLALDLEPAVRFTPPVNLEGESGDAVGGAGSFLTPVSTPQAGGNMMGTSVTVSPSADAVTAPPTPAPSDSTTAVPEKDAEGLLIDLEDETWSLLLDRSKIPLRHSPDNSPTTPILASGQLIKRGDPTSATQSHFPAIGADLLWTIQVRAAGAGIVEGNARHAEAMLREVLGTWRGLGCLAKLRGVGLGKSLEGLVPVHVVGAIEAARALEGMPR